MQEKGFYGEEKTAAFFGSLKILLQFDVKLSA